jgi:ComF family protein
MGLLDLVAPPACAGCGRYGEHLCERCRSSLRPAANTVDRFVVPDPAVVIGDDLEVAVAAFAYEGVLRRALSRLKYGSAARVAQPLARAAAPHLADVTQLLPNAVLVPVPVHADRLRQRGYNQAALLARHLASEVRLPWLDLLARVRPTTQQHRLNRVQRLRNLRGAFTLGDGARSPPVIILVDDILTTSATLEACAAVLRGAGAERVAGVTVAREI